MQGTLSITGELKYLSRLAKRIEIWSSGSVDIAVRPQGWGGWTIDSMTQLLERLHPWQLLLLNYVSAGGGRRADAEVRRNFEIGESGLRGQTGAISKHVEGMKRSGAVPADASHVIKVDRQTNAVTFEIPDSLAPILASALDQTSIAQRVHDARISQKWSER